MKNKGLYLLAFLAGVCAAAVVFQIVKRKETGEFRTAAQVQKSEVELEQQRTILESEGYIPNESETPYVIPDEEYSVEISDGNRPEYDLIHVTRFEDGVFANDTDCQYSECELSQMFGKEGCLDEINRFFTNSKNNMLIFVRNPVLKTDFEVVRDLRFYSDILDNPTTRPEAKFIITSEEE